MTRRDRTGEVVDDDQAGGDHHRCARGWVDRDRSVPCGVCRPWLLQRPARPPSEAELDEFRARHPTAAPRRRRRHRATQGAA